MEGDSRVLDLFQAGKLTGDQVDSSIPLFAQVIAVTSPVATSFLPIGGKRRAALTLDSLAG